MHPFTPETENGEFNESIKKIISSQPLTTWTYWFVYKSWRKYQMCSVASCYNYLIKLNQQMLILAEFVTIVFFINLTVKLNCWSTDSFKLNVIFNRENKHLDVWRLALIVWSNSIRTFLIHQDLLQKIIISFVLTT
jgi:hypothetical protein